MCGAHLALGEPRLGHVDRREHVLEEHRGQLHVLLAAEALQHDERRLRERGLRPPRPPLRRHYVAPERILEHLEYHRGPLRAGGACW